MDAVMDKIAIERYGDLKNSGVDWLGEIPAHWKLLANKYIFRLRKTQVGKRSSEFDLLSLTLNGVIKRDMDNPQGKFPAEFDTYQEVKKGDFVFCLFDVEETPRAIGLSPFNGMITGAYTVLESNEDFNKKFLYYFYLNLDTDKRLRPLYRGLRNIVPKESFFSFKTFVPPIEEQTAIAAFLDRKTAQIEKAIAQKEKLIELLKERRQILIHKAVTRGLDPDVPMKDSGVEWIGDIPAHWEMKKLKYVVRVLKRIANSDGFDVLSITQQGIKVKDIESGEGQLAMDYSKYQLIYKGEYAMNHMDLLTGYVGISQFNGVISPDYRVFELQNDLYIKEYLLYLFQMCYKSKIFYRYGQGVSQLGRWRFPAENFDNFKVTLPPKDEQRVISTFIARVNAKIDKALSMKKREIEKLKEYKATLINAAVTGKIKVL